MAESLVKAEKQSMAPAQWNLAWDEFGRRYPRLKHGPAIVAFLLFTFLGQSVVGLVSAFYGLLPLVVWILVFLSTTILAQMFVVNFSGKAHDRQAAEHKAKVEQLTAPKLIFEIDLRKKAGSNVRVERAANGIRIYLNLTLRLENIADVPIYMKTIRVALHRRGQAEEIFMWFALLQIVSNGVTIAREAFEPMRIAEHQLTDFYSVLFMVATPGDSDEQITLDANYYLKLTMTTTGYQSPVTAMLNPYWDGALKEGGSDQIIISRNGGKEIKEDYTRID